MDSKGTISQIPFLRLLIPFATGILLGLNFEIKAPFPLYIILLIFFSFFLVSLISSPNWHYRWVTGLTAMLFLGVGGFVLSQNFHGESQIPNNENHSVIARLIEPTEDRASSQRAIANVEWILQDSAWLPLEERVMLYFSANDTAASILQYGSTIALSARFNSPPQALNPHQFDYKQYLERNQIYRVAFVQSSNWSLTGSSQNPIFAKAYLLRDHLLNLYKKVGIEGENLAVLSALTMGYKSLLDHETKRVFSASGAMHILAVSGLHVGILYATISAFLFFFGRIKRGKLYKALLLLAFLWFFAIFTGLSPSVLRSTLMFSLVVIGTAINRKTSIYNTLSASAFVLLTIDPTLILNVGFQLSYLAVISIVFFYPHIYALVYVKNRWLDKVWSLIAVSLAAQLGTLPITLFYFNQFPNYFLLTNLYAIPLAFIVLYLSIALIMVSPLSFATIGIGWMLDKTLWLLNKLIYFTEDLPYSTLSGLSITSFQTVCLILSITLIAFFIENRRAIFLFSSLIFLLAFLGENAYAKVKQVNEKEMIVFSNKQATLIGFTKDKTLTIATSDSSNINLPQKYAFTLNGYVNKKGISLNPNTIPISNKFTDNQSSFPSHVTYPFGSWFKFGSKSIFVPFGNILNYATSEKPFPVDIVILGGMTKIEFNKLFNLIIPQLVVVDSSFPQWKLNDLENFLTEREMNYHIIDRNGAYILRNP